MNSIITFGGAPRKSRGNDRHFIDIVLRHKHPPKFYPEHCLLSREQAGEATWYHPLNYQQEGINFAQRLIDFTDSLNLPAIIKPSSLRSDNYKIFPSPLQREFYMFGHNTRDFVILDSPVKMEPVEGDGWESIWLPRGADPIRPGLGYPRLSTRQNSCINLLKLAERVSYLNFDSIEYEPWGF